MRMALVISVCALKGGVGKTTIALSLAGCLHRADRNVVLIDADSQATLRTWAAKAAESERDGPPVISLDGKSFRRDLARVTTGFDVVVIDSPPRMGTEARAAMLAADLVLLPVVPGAADVWALQETLAVLDDARGLRPELRAAVILNRTDRTELARLTKDAAGAVGVPTLECSLGSRVAFGEAMLSGQTVVDYAPESRAADEVRKLTTAVLAAVGATNDG